MCLTSLGSPFLPFAVFFEPNLHQQSRNRALLKTLREALNKVVSFFKTPAVKGAVFHGMPCDRTLMNNHTKINTHARAQCAMPITAGAQL